MVCLFKGCQTFLILLYIYYLGGSGQTLDLIKKRSKKNKMETHIIYNSHCWDVGLRQKGPISPAKLPTQRPD
jgi:hypothetical protein